MPENTVYLKALLQNDSKVITEIYASIFPKVKKFVLQNKGQQVDAEDIFQKALMQIAVRYRREPFEIKSSFEAFLFTACKNLWRRELNKTKTRVTDDGVMELQSEEKDMALATLEQERWELFTEKLELISENCKKVLQLFFAKVSYSEIVKRLGYNSETVARQRVFKCKTKLMQTITSDQRYNSLKEL
ncbi:sigma-70 family RNA polymerase sigma factor [uncultured Dokdonia sp.]|uniref:RNA polymerase sigma factor n=1 Tax=uncultured Dokdonia sp. TaxID=575653 RepID=UPI002618D13B|nr:sigma-70 family RNA polymerase sigma factor [uncultured Dokdonia sp.]